MIILEGPDNSGKSTFANKFPMPHFAAGPAPNNDEEEYQFLEFQKNCASIRCIQDRATCISQQIYREDNLFNPLLTSYLNEMLATPSCILVYCRPPERIIMDMSTHTTKHYDTEEHLKIIVENQHKYIERYDILMEKYPHIIYDWTDKNLASTVHKLLMDSQVNQYSWKLLKNLANVQSMLRCF